jgi:hypothetical protein
MMAGDKINNPTLEDFFNEVDAVDKKFIRKLIEIEDLGADLFLHLKNKLKNQTKLFDLIDNPSTIGKQFTENAFYYSSYMNNEKYLNKFEVMSQWLEKLKPNIDKTSNEFICQVNELNVIFLQYFNEK